LSKRHHNCFMLPNLKFQLKLTMVYNIRLVHIAAWTTAKREAYATIFGPVVQKASKVLPKKDIMRLRSLHPELKYFSCIKLKNRINSDIQKSRRRAQRK